MKWIQEPGLMSVLSYEWFIMLAIVIIIAGWMVVKYLLMRGE